jgi:Kef-type K+ transport system membrane component KefB
MTRATQLLALLVFVYVAREVQHLLGLEPLAEVIFAAGLILLASYLGGTVASAIGLPRITGYLLTGFLIGPPLLGLLDESMIRALRPVNGIAVSLIAMTAGMELSVRQLRRLWKRMLTLTAFNIAGVFVVVFLALLAASPFVGFLRNEPRLFVVTVCLVFASIAIATSPTVTIAIINEYRAKGPLTETVLSVTVLKDIVVIVFFASAMAVAKAALDPGRSFDPTFLRTIGTEIFGSIFAGALLGWLVSLVVARVWREAALFVIGLAVLISEGSLALHLEPLLVSLVAGFFLENISEKDAAPMLRGLERSSFPVYAVFFALAGASLHLDALLRLWPIALFLVTVRAGALWLGTWAGARLSGAPDIVRTHAWMGFISQAGVTLGLSVIVVRAFPDWGLGVQTIIVAMIAVHELIGPLAFRHALDKAGEIGRRGDGPEAGAH